MGNMSNEYINPVDWRAYTEQYSWARNCYEDLGYRWGIYQNSASVVKSSSAWDVDLADADYQLNYSDMINECGALAKWMVDKGWRVDIAPTLKEPDGKFSEIQPGDIIFFAESFGMNGFKIYAESMFHGYNYKNISHAAIVADAVVRNDMVGSEYPYAYQIQIICPPSLFENYLKQTSGHFEYSTKMEYVLDYENVYTNTNGLDHYLPSLSTIAMVCRPDLSSTKKSYLEIEAEKLGLHTVPENETQLNIIKRCRICTDIEWTPGRDYDREMPITGLSNKYNGNLTTYQDFPEFADSLMINDGSFKSGLSYVGLPFIKTEGGLSTGSPSVLQINQFISIVNNENAPINLVSDRQYPLYGWQHPKDFIGFVFGVDSIRDTIITDWYTYEFRQEIFEVPDGEFDPDWQDSNWQEPVRMGEFNWGNLKLGDIVAPANFGDPDLLSSIGVVTDIIKDSNNNIQSIELSEATRYGLVNPKNADLQFGNVIVRKIYSKDEFEQWYLLAWEGIAL